MVAFEEGRGAVSSMVAPSTATLSVIHNKTFGWAYGGMPHFKFEVFKQETTNAVRVPVAAANALRTKERLAALCTVYSEERLEPNPCLRPLPLLPLAVSTLRVRMLLPSNQVMAALLIHDVLNDQGPKHPKNREAFGVRNSLSLFTSQSVHGGLWRAPYKVSGMGANLAA